ncbi:MAG: type VII secretion-associated protein [Gordonia sp. (in: high G+C Gram-positive bacteria)]|uniref:type VII secretion-associated protein n=1 Tax=Gordonia sp. (in: high G+C Gram-positive bacteria) TaxID=84139 RepID=UPI0039E329C4
MTARGAGPGPAVVDLADAAFLTAVDDPDGVHALTVGLRACGVGPGTTTIGYPSTWGRPRRERLECALVGLGYGASPTPVPRALLIAASHADAAVMTCVVIETLLIPGEPPDGRAWSAQRAVRDGGAWRIDAGTAGEIDDDPARRELLDLVAGADLVLVDGAAAGSVSSATTAPGRRVIAVDRALVRRHGERWSGPFRHGAARLDFGFPPPPDAVSRRAARVVLVLAAATVLALGATGAVARWSRPGAAAVSTQRVGPVAMEVPAGWARTELSGDRPGDGRGVRAVFADRDDGRRLIVVVTALRPGATRASVAESMAHRIGQRGDDVVVEFAAGARYAGRSVIAYREVPASGPAVRWYIVVDPGTPLQVSIGCQAGSGEVEAVCRSAVASVVTG